MDKEVEILDEGIYNFVSTEVQKKYVKEDTMVLGKHLTGKGSN